MSTITFDTGFLPAWQACYLSAQAAVTDSALLQARRSWLDTLASIAAGARERCTQAALHACEASVEAGAVGQPSSTAGLALPLSAGDAALVLGTASHALDYDDVCMLAACHPSAPPVAALLAMLPAIDARRPAFSLRDLLSAYLVGTETLLRLGQWLGFRHYALGFHATSTLGVVGAAAACSHALGLPIEQARVALSIAASSACGLRANFGTDVKPLHVGFAASQAIRAVLLAQAGASSSDDVWGATGYSLAFNGAEPPATAGWRAGEPWAIDQPGFELKRFPSCYMSHRLIAGILALRHRAPAAERAVAARILIEIPRNGQAALKHPDPGNGLEAKFSGPYCAAAAWIDGRVDLATFDDAAVSRPALREQMQRVSIVERTLEGEALESAPVNVRIEAGSFSETVCVDWALGSLRDPITRKELLDKWGDCVQRSGLSIDESLAMAVLDATDTTQAESVLGPLRRLLLEAIVRA